MKTIKENVVNEIIINKSRFITVLIKINNIKDINEEINKYKNIYKNATHYCYGYIIDTFEKCSDDKEPSGTAGVPILNILKNNDLTNVLCLVIRYFGGVKLGSGGLTRAYSRCAKEALEKASTAYLINGYHIVIEFDYDNTKIVDNALKDIIISKNYDKKIKYEFNISKDKYRNIENIFIKYCIILKKEPILFAI